MFNADTVYVILLCVHCHHIKYPFFYIRFFSLFFMNNLHDFKLREMAGVKSNL